MPNLNRVILMGNLTRDPELRQTTNSDVCHFSLAINRNYSDASGQKQQETTYVDAEAWGRTAQVITQYLHKGEPLLIEGRLKLDQWQDQNGQNRSKLKVVAENVQFVGARPQIENDGAPPRSQNQQNNRRPQMATAAR